MWEAIYLCVREYWFGLFLRFCYCMLGQLQQCGSFIQMYLNIDFHDLAKSCNCSYNGQLISSNSNLATIIRNGHFHTDHYDLAIKKTQNRRRICNYKTIYIAEHEQFHGCNYVLEPSLERHKPSCGKIVSHSCFSFSI